MGRHKAPTPPGDEAGGPFDLGVLTGLTLGELQRRLGDEEQAKELPGTGLIQIAKELLKLGERQQPAAEPEERSVVDQVDALPAAHALRVLQAERERLTAELARLDLKLEELRDGEALPDMPTLVRSQA